MAWVVLPGCSVGSGGAGSAGSSTSAAGVVVEGSGGVGEHSAAQRLSATSLILSALQIGGARYESRKPTACRCRVIGVRALLPRV